jgi:hypothetical protein
VKEKESLASMRATNLDEQERMAARAIFWLGTFNLSSIICQKHGVNKELTVTEGHALP